MVEFGSEYEVYGLSEKIKSVLEQALDGVLVDGDYAYINATVGGDSCDTDYRIGFTQDKSHKKLCNFFENLFSLLSLSKLYIPQLDGSNASKGGYSPIELSPEEFISSLFQDNGTIYLENTQIYVGDDVAEILDVGEGGFDTAVMFMLRESASDEEFWEYGSVNSYFNWGMLKGEELEWVGDFSGIPNFSSVMNDISEKSNYGLIRVGSYYFKKNLAKVKVRPCTKIDIEEWCERHYLDIEKYDYGFEPVISWKQYSKDEGLQADIDSLLSFNRNLCLRTKGGNTLSLWVIED